MPLTNMKYNSGHKTKKQVSIFVQEVLTKKEGRGININSVTKIKGKTIILSVEIFKEFLLVSQTDWNSIVKWVSSQSQW